jgi:hypothetical protein
VLVVGEVVPTKNLRRGGFCSSGGVMAVAGEGKNAMAMLVEGDALLVLRVEGAEGGGSLNETVWVSEGKCPRASSVTLRQ